MFTGIVEELGTVRAFTPQAAGARLIVGCAKVLDDMTLGASIAVNGVCLTAVEIHADGFSADLAPETLSRTNLNRVLSGSRVNLERPVTPATRLSGHIVQGHVDGTAEVVRLEPLGEDNWWLDIRVPRDLQRYLVEKGSITLDGISLTIAKLDSDMVGLTIIPHTYTSTTLQFARLGSPINVEVDVLAKHVERLLQSRLS